MKFLRIALAWLALTGVAYAQAQLGAGQVLGNNTAATRPPQAASVTSILDRAFGTTNGGFLQRGASDWALQTSLPAVNGGTGLTTFAIGDLLQANSTTTLARLAAVATGNVLLSGGVGTVSAWGKVASTHLNITTTTCTNQYVTAISATGTGTCSSVAYAGIASSSLATASEYAAATASKIVPASVIYPTEVTITYGATTTIDFDTLINGAVTLTGNITTLTLTNVRAGKAGQIRFIQSSAGSYTWPAGGNTVFKYASGTLPALTTGSTTAVDVLTYSCSSATFCVASLIKDVRNP
jgi:hypothetical protein